VYSSYNVVRLYFEVYSEVKTDQCSLVPNLAGCHKPEGRHWDVKSPCLADKHAIFGNVFFFCFLLYSFIQLFTNNGLVRIPKQRGMQALESRSCKIFQKFSEWLFIHELEQMACAWWIICPWTSNKWFCAGWVICPCVPSAADDSVKNGGHLEWGAAVGGCRALDRVSAWRILYTGSHGNALNQPPNTRLTMVPRQLVLRQPLPRQVYKRNLL